MRNDICQYVKKWLGYLLMALVLALAGCGGDESATSGQESRTAKHSVENGKNDFSTLAIIPSADSVEVGHSLSFMVKATNSSGVAHDVTTQATCVSSQTAVATISTSGVIQAVATGETSISCDVGELSAGGIVIRVSGKHSVSQLQITPGVTSVAKGTHVQYTALAFYHDGTRKDVTDQVVWSSSASGTASVDSNGLVIAQAAGNTVITGVFDGITSNSADLTVTDASLVSLDITTSGLSLAIGTEQQLTVIGHYTDGTTQNLTAQVAWNSDDLLLATVSDTGLLITLLNGTVTISASLGDVTSDGILVTIKPAVMNGLQITPGNINLPEGTSHPLTAIASFSDGTTQNVTNLVNWASSDTAVANVMLTGSVHALAEGTAVISANLQGIESNHASVTVSAASVLSISVDPLLTTIANGTTQQLKATALFSDGSLVDITAQANWLSGDTSIATVSTDGLVQGIAEGSTVISAHLQGTVSNEHSLTVTSALLTELSITPVTTSIAKGTAQLFNAIATFSDGTTQDVTNLVSWASSNTQVAIIDAKGRAQALSQGATNIVAQYLATQSLSVTLTVTAETMTSLNITPAILNLANGLDQQLQAVATFTDGSTQDVTDLVSWLSSNTAVATVNSGMVQGISEGAATVSGRYEGFEGTADLNVTAAALDRVRVESDHMGELAIQLLGSSIFNVTTNAYYTDGTRIVIDNSLVTYHSTETSLLTVNTEGLVTLKAGVLTNERISSVVNFSGTMVNSENTINVNCLAALPPLASICTIGSIEQPASGH
ncbi:Ig-like domain-containing protein [Photobacterium sp. WH24]|uniref:Ig-like domain-containing protein n=1 Tax=Photobacterium sp. WH24 TaxID=2827237 RepID=UPI001C4382A3|nr:Ig-like domain-containing protein [Photobacterium sp. WH24]MBV7264288.1 Ig-like domain-containing protein [Photobacterium sp. WH24]